MSEQSYLVTARKYRPSLFREVVAQEHVTETLKNAIAGDRLAHAYLFSGPRGVGKTTAARILAKAINCETPREEREDGAEPCCECDSCVSFEEGRSLNVFEMDAASNNKVDDVRELREKVRIPPQGEQKKVYILDEVHMLSKQAFNALLKTLEEPPAHALFIFATTEPHKVLPTILSRCQRFDFRRIPVPRMVERLREVCETEGVEADEESLMLLARKGNGALRDALSAFDQALSLCGSTLEYGELAQALGVVDQDLYFELTEHVATQDTAGVLTLVRHVVRSGYDLQEFLAGLAEHLRNLLVAHSLGGDALDGVAQSTRRRYAEEAERFGEADLLRLLTVAGDAEDDVKNSPQPRLKLETTLLKMAQMRRAADLRTVLQKIDRLEKMADEGRIPASIDGGDASANAADGSEAEPAPAAESPSTDPETAEPTPSYDTDAPESADGPPTEEDAARPSPAPPQTDDPSDPAAEEESAESDDGATASTATEEEPDRAEPDAPEPDAPDPQSEETDDEDDPSADEPPPSAGSSDATVEYGDLFGTPALDDEAGGDGASGDGTDDATGRSGDRPSGGDGPKATVAEPTVDSGRSAVDDLADRWPQLVRAVKQDRISLGSLLDETEPAELRNETLTITVPKALHRDTLRDQRRILLEHLAATADRPIEELRFVVEESSGTTAESGGADPVSPREQLQALRDTYPALEVLFTEFDAEPVW